MPFGDDNTRVVSLQLDVLVSWNVLNFAIQGEKKSHESGFMEWTICLSGPIKVGVFDARKMAST